MNLSDGEKLIIAMLCDMYEQQEIEGEIDHRFIQKTLWSGQYWGLRWKMPGIFDAAETSTQVIDETTNYMMMWTIIEASYAKLDEDEKKRVEAEAEPFGKNPQFRGFDANHDSHYGVAQYLIEHLDRFQDFKGRYLNSHSPVLEGYERMYEEFEPVMSSLMGRPMDADQIITVLKAQTHPSMR